MTYTTVHIEHADGDDHDLPASTQLMTVIPRQGETVYLTDGESPYRTFKVVDVRWLLKPVRGIQHAGPDCSIVVKPVPDGQPAATHGEAFDRIEAVLDEFLGTASEDGSGEGQHSDVRLLGLQRNLARTLLAEAIGVLREYDPATADVLSARAARHTPDDLLED